MKDKSKEFENDYVVIATVIYHRITKKKRQIYTRQLEIEVSANYTRI